jgi:hypothetical protein
VLGQVQGPPVVGSGGVRVAECVHDQSRQVNLPALDRAPRVQPSQQQEVLDKHGHPHGLGLDPAQGVRDVGWNLLRAAPAHLGVAADHCERRTELVTGIGDELADPGLAGLACPQRGCDVLEHVVERRTDLADLRSWIGVHLGDPNREGDLAVVERELGHPGRGGRHPV